MSCFGMCLFLDICNFVNQFQLDFMYLTIYYLSNKQTTRLDAFNTRLLMHKNCICRSYNCH